MKRARGSDRLRAVELYCGIGGAAVAMDQAVDIVAAIDINRRAVDVYRHNLPHPVTVATLESLSAAAAHHWDADLWWLSPPCQPFTRRGRQRDRHDSRTRSFLDILTILPQACPRYLAIENVPAFRHSLTRSILLETLDDLGYSLQETVLCPTAFGVPNRRQRYYLVAGRSPLRQLSPPPLRGRSLSSYLDREPTPDLWVDPELVRRYRPALDIVDPLDPFSVAACFTSAYGHSPVRSGSYLQTDSGLRRFSPAEILRLLGFPGDYRLPDDLPLQSAWRLTGNSLSLLPVRHVLSAIPQLTSLALPASTTTPA